MTLTLQLSTEAITATVSSDDEIHPDLLDELARRVLRLFVEANESLDFEGDDDGDNGG